MVRSAFLDLESPNFSLLDQQPCLEPGTAILLTSRAYSFITDPAYQASNSESESEGGLVSTSVRPNVPQIIETAVASTTDKLAIVVCGPQSMTVDARNVVSNILKGGNQNVKLFIENFGW